MATEDAVATEDAASPGPAPGAGEPATPPRPPQVHALAAELHDGLSQQLFAAELDVHELRFLPGMPDEAAAIIDRLEGHLTAGSKALRATLFKLLEVQRDRGVEGPVAEGIRDGLARFRREHGLHAELDVIGDGPEPDPDRRRLLRRVVGEGLANVAKHAGATEARVVLRRDARWCTVEVHDDGVGDPEVVRRRTTQASSFGLFSLSEEATRVRGRLWFCAAQDLGGLALKVAVPAGATGECGPAPETD